MEILSAANLAENAGALRWRARLVVPHGVGWLDHYEYYATMQAAVQALFADAAFPQGVTEAELRYERDTLGKPYITWDGVVAEWAREHGRESRFLHVSNTHDGGAHVVLAAYHPDLVGLGLDAVYLPRLAQGNKDAAYLRRFAARFMSAREQAVFENASREDSLEALRVRVAAHFSLMEAASKACGTGLKVGVGMGRDTSLPKQSLGALALEPDVEMLFEGEARERLEALGAHSVEAHWSANATFLLSVVLLWRTSR